MTCRDCREILEEYLDGELGASQAEAVAEHLTGCNGCTREFNQLQAELEVYLRHGSDIEVRESLWAGVQARLEVSEPSFSNQPHSRLAGWFAGVFSVRRVSVPVTAGLVLAAILVTTVVLTLMRDSEKITPVAQTVKNVESHQTESPTLNASKPAVEKPEREFNRSEEFRTRKTSSYARSTGVVETSKSRSPEQLVREAEKKYLAAIGMLSRDIERQQPQLDQETRMKFEQALASIDRTIGATRKAVRQHPTDPLAVQYMLSAYARKVDVLREMAGSGAF